MINLYNNLSTHYDKLLHALVTFALVIWLDRAISIYDAIMVVFALQCGKVVVNKRSDHDYRMLGDWLANGVGWLIALGWYL